MCCVRASVSIFSTQDQEVHLWLKDMLTHGKERISHYLNSSDLRQQHVAQRLVEAIDNQQPIAN